MPSTTIRPRYAGYEIGGTNTRFKEGGSVVTHKNVEENGVGRAFADIAKTTVDLFKADEISADNPRFVTLVWAGEVTDSDKTGERKELPVDGFGTYASNINFVVPGFEREGKSSTRYLSVVKKIYQNLHTALIKADSPNVKPKDILKIKLINDANALVQLAAADAEKLGLKDGDSAAHLIWGTGIGLAVGRGLVSKSFKTIQNDEIGHKPLCEAQKSNSLEGSLPSKTFEDTFGGRSDSAETGLKPTLISILKALKEKTSIQSALGLLNEVLKMFGSEHEITTEDIAGSSLLGLSDDQISAQALTEAVQKNDKLAVAISKYITFRVAQQLAPYLDQVVRLNVSGSVVENLFINEAVKGFFQKALSTFINKDKEPLVTVEVFKGGEMGGAETLARVAAENYDTKKRLHET